METPKVFTYEKDSTIDHAPKDPAATVGNMAERAIALSSSDGTTSNKQITEWPVDLVTNGDSEIFYDKNSGSALPMPPRIDHMDVL